MHKLERPEPPTCLARFRPGRDAWPDLGTDDRKEIRSQLATMQGQRCAYCEVGLAIEVREGHIEHFEQRSRNSARTFDWDNLFGSCDQQDSCGKHKDRLASTYRWADLIKPDVDDPDDYLRFLSDGRIVARESLDVEARRRAEETLRVFNLDHDCGRLRHMRRNAAYGYVGIIAELDEYAEADTGLYLQYLIYLQNELQAIRGKPFETAIRHTLNPL